MSQGYKLVGADIDSVTTLTSPERLMSRHNVSRFAVRVHCYNPHQPRKADVTQDYDYIYNGAICVTTLTSPERLMSLFPLAQSNRLFAVTTLTSPERLMSLPQSALISSIFVTTLTSPERLMSRGVDFSYVFVDCQLQPSPAPKG